MRYLPSDTGLIYETEVSEETKESQYPPSTEAVYNALGGVSGDIPTETEIKAYVYDKILMSANDKTYEVTIDGDGALAVAEVTD